MILDTNGLSAFADNDPALLRVLRTDRPWYLPVVVIGEYLFGLERSREKESRLGWLEGLLGAVVVLDITGQTARHYAGVRHELHLAGWTLPLNDAWIAALAREFHLPVVSRDRHFDSVPGLRRIRW